MKFGNKMLKPVICKYTVNMNKNIKFDQFRCNQERMLVTYRKLIPGEANSAKIKVIIKFIQGNAVI